jgi:sarcosine oxidase subunit beta
MNAFCQKDGHANPFHVVQAYANAAKRLGVEIYTHTEVTGIKTENGKILGVVTNKGEIATNKIVNTAGAYAQVIGEMAGVKIPSYSERHQILVTEPVNPVLGPMVMSFSLNIYVQQTPHGSLIMGYGDPNEPHSYSTDSSWDFMEEMARKTTKLLPLLKDLRVVRQWAGLYDMTEDRQPILGGHPDLDGFYMSCGYSGHGFMLGPVAGLLMAEYILGEETSIDISKLDVGRFERGELVWEPSVV